MQQAAPDSNIIPLLGVPVVLDPGGAYTARLIRSIDHPVQQLVVVYGGDAQADTDTWHSLLRLRHEHANLTLLRSTPGLGVSEGWNYVLLTAPEVPWLIITSYDVALQPGALALLARQYTADLLATPELMGHIDIKQHGSGDLVGTDYNLMVLSRPLIDSLGSFDENFWPAYFEDNDYCRRMALLYGPWPEHSGHRKWYREAQAVHGGLSSWKETSLGSKATDLFPVNQAYLQAKWGCQDLSNNMEACSFSKPWNLADASIGHWRFDADRRQSLNGVREQAQVVQIVSSTYIKVVQQDPPAAPTAPRNTSTRTRQRRRTCFWCSPEGE